MDSEVCIKTSFDKDDNLNIELSGKDMGVLIGKRGQTLDSIQYLTSLVVNKGNAYVRVKVDTENYRARRKETLENLAKNIAFKVKRTKKPVFLEPMNPYERRVIHSALQNDPLVSTHSEGEEPYRKVVVTLKNSKSKIVVSDMSLIFSAADMLPKIRLFEYQEESMKGETIAAISTAVSSSGIGIVRISGDQAFEIADRVYRSPKGKKKLSEQQSHTVHYGYICDGDEVLDEVLVVLMRAPRSFTAEDTVEIDCHGGVYAIQRVLEAVIKNGAAPAEPGEFTKRAFLNGRMDLSQAEAVMDVIEAKMNML